MFLLLWKVSLCGGSLSFLFLFLPPVLCHSWDYNLAWFLQPHFPRTVEQYNFWRKKRIFFRPKLDKKTINIRREKSRGRPPCLPSLRLFRENGVKGEACHFRDKSLDFFWWIFYGQNIFIWAFAEGNCVFNIDIIP